MDKIRHTAEDYKPKAKLIQEQKKQVLIKE